MAAGRRWGERGSAVLELPRTLRMVCVEYPGLVRDVGAMLLTLGGEQGVSRIYADPAKRLELYFRPKDPYCHPVCANRFPTSTMLLKVKRRTKKKKQLDTEEQIQPEVQFEMEILGTVTTVYKFQGMSDFQYLAMHSGPDGKQTSMYDKVLMLKPEKEEFFNRELPLYIPPPIFSRLDTPVDYFYRPDIQHREGYNNPQVSGENLIGLSRARRPHNAIFVNFDDEEIPTKPLDAAVQTWKKVCTNPVDKKAEEELRKLFEVPPVWSQNAVKANISVHLAKLELLLPYLAYYMLGVVHTEGGFVEGESKKLGLFGSYIDIFRGIPFAAPPKTLEDPQPHPGWDGTLQAKEFKNRCMQMTLTQSDVRGKEDCLYLNIWIPQGKRQVSTNLPVMVWIYGGGFLVGGSQGANFLSNYLYDGEEIAVRGNVIVVTVNYRLGPLGFLSTGDENLPGNYGLKDQHMAIAWVKRNIKAFGGDPENITIFGESAGAASVSLQTLSPKNKGLFKRAISQSGVGLCSWAIQRDPLTWAKKLGQKVGCPLDNTTVLADCLRISDPKTLTLAYHLQLINLPVPLVHTLAITPVVDGDFLPDMPENLFANAADIDYIAGVNDMDGHIFAGIDLPAINRPFVKVTADEVYNLIKGLTVDRGERGANATYNIYTQPWGDNPSQELIKKTVVDLITDYIFLVPTQWALNLHLQNARNAKTYSYLFSQPSRMPVYPSWVGADHADDLQYVFGKPFATPLGYLPKHRTVSGAMIAYWTNFARTGDPNKGNSKVPVNWPPYTNEASNYLEINNKLSQNSVKQNLKSRFVTFWNTVYQSLPQVANISLADELLWN